MVFDPGEFVDWKIDYVTGLLRKLKVASRTEAAIYATKLKNQN